MSKQLKAFKDKEVFELIKIKEIRAESKITPMIQSFKRKRRPNGELIKHKTRLCANGVKITKVLDYQNTHAPISQSTTIRLMIILASVNG